MTNEQKAQLVEQMAALASDSATGGWSARLYMCTAVWLESELKRTGHQRDGTFLTVAAEKVKHRDRGPEPTGFRGAVDGWLDPASG
ncbi:MAG: hypothetical protein HS104_09790 [Polyangiaceae bacterium]|nr:hypothetical protein [Polyangiaceae bacterium]MCE7890380.1 hypothetical protein [Sorangiineae bacterium PRO1]MCL4754376.1 hypothetical protein [Myxococcales bacterium]